MTVISSIPEKSVRCREVCTIKDVRYKEVSLYVVTVVEAILIGNLSDHSCLNSCWRMINCGELSAEITLLGLLHIVKPASKTWRNTRVRMNSIVTRSFQQKPCREMVIMQNVNFALSDSNNKDQLRDLYNYLNRKW